MLNEMYNDVGHGAPYSTWVVHQICAKIANHCVAVVYLQVLTIVARQEPKNITQTHTRADT